MVVLFDYNVSLQTRELDFDEIWVELIRDAHFENEDAGMIAGVRNESLAGRVMKVRRNEMLLLLLLQLLGWMRLLLWVLFELFVMMHVLMVLLRC